MRSALPVNIAKLGQTQIGFMDKAGRLQGVVRTLGSETRRRDPMQFPVDERNELFFRRPVAGLQLVEKFGDFARMGHSQSSRGFLSYITLFPLIGKSLCEGHGLFRMSFLLVPFFERSPPI